MLDCAIFLNEDEKDRNDDGKRTAESYLLAMIARGPLGHVYFSSFFSLQSHAKTCFGIIYKPVSRFRSRISVDGNVDNSSGSSAS